MTKIPLQHRRVQQRLGGTHNSQEFFSSTNFLLPGSNLVLTHVTWNQFIWNATIDKGLNRIAKLIDQLIGNMNVDLEESE